MSALVSVSWLSAHRSDVVVLDASVHRSADGYSSGRGDFEESHLPGARFADLVDVFSEPGAPYLFTRPPVAQFSFAAASLGLHDDTTVVVYDRLSGAWAARLWWVFRSYGFADVRVLDGGLAAWVAAGQPTSSGPSPLVPAGSVTATPRDDLFVGIDEVPGSSPLVCALREPDFRAGHIPGSVNLPYNDLLAADGTLSVAKAAAAGAALGLDSGGRATLYCGGAVNAAGLALALHEAGYDNVTLYDGSLNEWKGESRPLAHG